MGVPPGEMPRMYLATGQEIGSELRRHWFGELALSLFEHRAPQHGKNKGKVMRIPPEWRMGAKRIRDVVEKNAEPAVGSDR